MKYIGSSRRGVAAATVAIGTLLLAACSTGSSTEEAPPGPPAPEITAGAYLPDDGLIVVELESGSAAGDWSEETALNGFTGTSYLRWNGPNLFNSPGQDPFGFDLWIDDPGVYQFRIHNRHDDPDPTMSNDVFVRMDGGDWIKVFSSTRGVWTWASRHEFSSNNKPEAEYTLDAGNHRIEFSGRSFDYSIDRFHLYDTGVTNPLDTSHPESSRFGVGGSPSGFALGAEESDRSRRLVLGPVAMGGSLGFDAAERWDTALRTAAPVGRTVDVAVVGATAGADSQAPFGLDPGCLAAETASLLRDLPMRWRDRADLRWTFDAGPSATVAALDELARLVRSNDAAGRPLVLRIAPEELITRWPHVQHSAFDEIVLLRTVRESNDGVAAARALIVRFRPDLLLSVEVGADRSRED